MPKVHLKVSQFSISLLENVRNHTEQFVKHACAPQDMFVNSTSTLLTKLQLFRQRSAIRCAFISGPGERL